jgi:hypothetical protein
LSSESMHHEQNKPTLYSDNGSNEQQQSEAENSGSDVVIYTSDFI